MFSIICVFLCRTWCGSNFCVAKALRATGFLLRTCFKQKSGSGRRACLIAKLHAGKLLCSGIIIKCLTHSQHNGEQPPSRPPRERQMSNVDSFWIQNRSSSQPSTTKPFRRFQKVICFSPSTRKPVQSTSTNWVGARYAEHDLSFAFMQNTEGTRGSFEDGCVT